MNSIVHTYSIHRAIFVCTLRLLCVMCNADVLTLSAVLNADDQPVQWLFESNVINVIMNYI